MTALGIYLTVSLFMVVAALLEFAIVLIVKDSSQNTHSQSYRSVNDESLDKKKEESKIANHSGNIDHSNEGRMAWVERNKISCTEKPIQEKIDRVCFGMFPMIYVVFNVIYWAYYGLI